MSQYDITTHKGYIIKTFIDDDPYNPRDNDDLATLWTIGRYNIDELPASLHDDADDADILIKVLDAISCDYPLGGPIGKAFDRVIDEEYRYSTPSEEYLDELLDLVKKYGVIEKIYRYEHSAIAYSTSPFSCRWDSGQVGYAFMSKPAALKYFNAKRFTKKIAKLAEQYLDDAVSEYSDAINAENFYIRIEDSHGVEINEDLECFTSIAEASEAAQKFIDSL